MIIIFLVSLTISLLQPGYLLYISGSHSLLLVPLIKELINEISANHHKLISEIECDIEKLEDDRWESKYSLKIKKKRVDKAKKVHKAVKSIKKQSLGPMKEGKRERKKRK